MKELVLADYVDRRVPFKIKDNAKLIVITVLSGDETASIFYDDGTSEYCDSSNDRNTDFHDGVYYVPLEKLEEFNNLSGDSYERMDKVLGWLDE